MKRDNGEAILLHPCLQNNQMNRENEESDRLDFLKLCAHVESHDFAQLFTSCTSLHAIHSKLIKEHADAV